MKKFFITTIAIIFALSLALMIGCAGNPDTPDGGKTETSVTIAASDKAYVVTGGTLEGIATAKDESGNALIVTVNTAVSTVKLRAYTTLNSKPKRTALRRLKP